jgi:hypothetical protein
MLSVFKKIIVTQKVAPPQLKNQAVKYLTKRAANIELQKLIYNA